MRKIIVATTLAALTIPAYAESDRWVLVDDLNRRTCPGSMCGIVGVLKFREKATVLEEVNGWVRITQYYDAVCVDGVSEYVDSGNRQCSPSNGIRNGKFAEWVSSQYLSPIRPEDPAKNAPLRYELVRGSDDFRTHKDTFAKAADALIASGQCSAGDFMEMGGWVKSSEHRSEPIYFTYCGGMRSSNKVYLNAATGQIER